MAPWPFWRAFQKALTVIKFPSAVRYGQKPYPPAAFGRAGAQKVL